MTRFWYDADGKVLRATSDSVRSFPGAVGFTTVRPDSGKQRWNGSGWGPLPPKSDEERIDEAFPATDAAHLIFEVFFNHENRIRTQESRPAITKAELRDVLKSFLNQQ